MSFLKSRLLAALLVSGSVVVAGLALPAAAEAPPLASPAIDADVVSMWQTNPTIWALQHQGGVLFAGGNFTSVRPPGADIGVAEQAQPSLAAFDAGSGEFISSWRPFLERGKGSGRPGTVFAFASSPDGTTLYVGGRFTHIDGNWRPNVAAFDITNPWAPQLLPWKEFPLNPNGKVGALAAIDDTLYVGGEFTKVKGVAQARAAAFNTRTGKLVREFAPTLTQPYQGYKTAVTSITATASRVYLGGMFNQVNGIPQNGLAVVEPGTGASVPGFAVPALPPASIVTTSTLHDGVLYIAGKDEKTTNRSRLEGVMALDAVSGATLWGANNARCLGDSFAVLVAQATLWTGTHAHDCSAFDGFPELRPRFYGAVVGHDISNSGRLVHFFPQVGGSKSVKGSQNNVRALATDGQQLFVGGGWLRANGAPQSSLMRFDTAGPGDVPTPSYATAATTVDGSVEVSFRSAVDRDSPVITYEVYRRGTPDPVGTLSSADVPWRKDSHVIVDSEPGQPGARVQYRVVTSDGDSTATSAWSRAIVLP